MEPEAEAFYAEALRELLNSRVPFLVAGTFAVNQYTGLNRPTKDLDVFCKASDFPKILAFFKALGYETGIEDERWIAFVSKGPYKFDVIFNSTVAVTPITDQWFSEAPEADIYGATVKLVPPTELVYSKIFVQDRYKYDGSDVAHIILRQNGSIDWKRLLAYLEQYWEALFIVILNFRFIYPTEREKIPRWLLDELLERLEAQASLPTPQMKVCRGRLFSRSDYLTDITEWGFADLIGEAGEKGRHEHDKEG
jgi:hypothetical protein